MKCEHEWSGGQEIFSRPHVIEILVHICFSEQIVYRKQSLGAPEIKSVKLVVKDILKF